jgi:serine/threonine protein kinase
MNAPAATTSDRDERLAALLEDLAAQQKRGKAADVDALAQQHPDLANELRALWATAQFAAFAKPSSSTPPDSTAAVLNNHAPPSSFGDYELLEELGRGGMGVVYKARQRSLNRLVAIKLMREARLSSEEDRARFRAEAEAAARLKHPNIVTVHEVGEHDGHPFLVMEYVEGQTLSRRIVEHGPFTPRDAARLVAAVARAVQHAHDHGILHRDLKPGNILISSELRVPSSESAIHSELGTRNSELVKVTDFGLAKKLAVASASASNWRTQTGAIVGTPGYMAPEQATGRKDLTAATDVYALGAILYEMLTGRPPFLAANAFDTYLMVIEQEPLPPRALDPGIDRDLEMICLKCLQKPPGLRYASAAELARELEAFVAGESLSSQPSGLRYFLARMLRETHHVAVLENWGLLWMWHSLATFVLCLLTQVLYWSGVREHEAYLALWTVGLIAWGAILWRLRARAGPVLFVERQIAHAWAAGVCASIAMFVIEVLAGLPVLTLSPAIAVAAGMVFVFKAGILSGRFYITAGVMFLTAAVMPLVPQVSILLFGTATALCFFVPGLKYYRQRRRALAESGSTAPQASSLEGARQ